MRSAYMTRRIGRWSCGLSLGSVVGSAAVSPDEIQKLRKDLSCSAHELGRTLGVDSNTVVAWESGELFPTKRHVEQMRAIREKGPDAIVRAPRGKQAKRGMERLDDPKLWEILRKLLEHPPLFDQVVKLADAYDDPTRKKPPAP
jgi:DNA-binding XRE family transcriptional regulator